MPPTRCSWTRAHPSGRKTWLFGRGSSGTSRACSAGWPPERRGGPLRTTTPSRQLKKAAREARGSAASKGLAIDIVLIDDDALAEGDLHVAAKNKQASPAWLDRVAGGKTCVFII